TITFPGYASLTSTAQAGVGHTHLVLVDTAIAIPDGYAGASNKESSQYSAATGGLNGPYFLAIPSGVANYYLVISQGTFEIPQIGKKRYLTIDRWGTRMVRRFKQLLSPSCVSSRHVALSASRSNFASAF